MSVGVEPTVEARACVGIDGAGIDDFCAGIDDLGRFGPRLVRLVYARPTQRIGIYTELILARG